MTFKIDGRPVVDQLMAQRDAVLFGTWTPRTPDQPGEACTVARVEVNGRRMAVSREAMLVVSGVFRRLFPRFEALRVVDWNDHQAQRHEVLTVLDEAIRLAKELADDERQDADG